MILPIVAYGTPVLTKVAQPVEADYPDLGQLIENMFETMYNAKGVGLAAPQVGLSIRLFVVDSKQILDEPENEDFPGETGIVKAFINAEILEETGDEWTYSEGCLSIPAINENVSRPPRLRIRYLNENFEPQEEVYEGFTARVIQHEYDHIEGTLFTDYLSPVRKRLLKKRLDNISKGKVDVSYRMKFPAMSKRR